MTHQTTPVIQFAFMMRASILPGNRQLQSLKHQTIGKGQCEAISFPRQNIEIKEMAVGMLRSQERHRPLPPVPHSRGLLYGLYHLRIIHSINKKDREKPGSKQKREVYTSAKANLLSIFIRGETCTEGPNLATFCIPWVPVRYVCLNWYVWRVTFWVR